MNLYLLKRYETFVTAKNSKDWDMEMFKHEALKDPCPVDLGEFGDEKTAIRALDEQESMIWNGKDRVTEVTRICICALEVYKEEGFEPVGDPEFIFGEVQDDRQSTL